MAEAKKRGRPAKPKAERAPTVNFTMRMRPQLLEELRKSAELEDRTISAEAERRLAQPVVGELARFVDLAVNQVEKSAGSTWRESEMTALRVNSAIETLLSVVLGEFPRSTTMTSKALDEADRLMPEIEKRIANNVKPTAEEKEEVVQLLRLSKLAAQIAEDSADVAEMVRKAWTQ